MSHACFGSRHLRTRAIVALAGVLIAATLALPSERAAAHSVDCQSAARNRWEPTGRSYYIGFRLALN